MPKYSVVIPTRDRPALVVEAVRSVLDQRVQDFEIIVVNDGTITPELPDDPRISLVEGPKSGPAGARNAGIAAAVGEYIAFLDDDDTYTRERLEVPEVPVSVVWRIRRGKIRKYGGDVVAAYVGQVTIRRDLCPEFDPSMPRSQDVDWWIRVSSSHEPVVVERVGVLIGEPEDERQSSRVPVRVHMDCIIRLLNKHPTYFAAHPKIAAYRWKQLGAKARQVHARRFAISCYWRSFRIRPEPKTLLHLARAAIR
jgi:cellulose synthase/poly-beta-1,6-N-acetylglucosamine synthase-like glycosyltransferase